VLHGFVANSTRRWSGLRYKLGPRGIVELMAERWLRLAHMAVSGSFRGNEAVRLKHFTRRQEQPCPVSRSDPERTPEA
jgi:hypothetical protein